jgi:hypothetical protein
MHMMDEQINLARYGVPPPRIIHVVSDHNIHAHPSSKLAAYNFPVKICPFFRKSSLATQFFDINLPYLHRMISCSD